MVFGQTEVFGNYIELIQQKFLITSVLLKLKTDRRILLNYNKIKPDNIPEAFSFASIIFNNDK